MTTLETEFLVLGLGAVGAAVAYQLELRGRAFIGIDRHHPPHRFGSSHGETRITREAVGEGLDYVPLVQRSHRIWDDLERKTGQVLRSRPGILYLSTGARGAARNGAADFLADTARVAAAAGIGLVHMGATALREAYPQFVIGPEAEAYLEPDAGFVRPETCIAAQLHQVPAEKLRLGETVLGLTQRGAGVEVETDLAIYRADRALIAMGAWTPDFVGGPFRTEVSVLRQVQFWFRPDDPALWRPEASPGFIWFHGAETAEHFYGFPQLVDGRGVKVATEQHLVETDPDALGEVTPAEAAEMFRLHVGDHLRGVSSDCLDAMACLYTYNRRRGPDGREGRFLIGAHPQVTAATVVSACSGHGFKHSAGLGEALAQQLVGDPTFCDLTAFAVRA